MKNKFILYVLAFITIFVMGLIINITYHSNASIYGTYTIKDIVYHSPLSSMSPDGLREQMIGTEIILNKNYYKTDALEIENPIYRKERIDQDIVKSFRTATLNTISIGKYLYKYQYTIMKSENEGSHYRVYFLDNKIWLASYHDTNNNGYGFMYIFELKKNKS